MQPNDQGRVMRDGRGGHEPQLAERRLGQRLQLQPVAYLQLPVSGDSTKIERILLKLDSGNCAIPHFIIRTFSIEHALLRISRLREQPTNQGWIMCRGRGGREPQLAARRLR